MDQIVNSGKAFLAYSLRDRVKVHNFIKLMTESLGISTFDPEDDILPGQTLLRSLEIGVAKSKASFLFISKNFIRDKLCQFLVDSLLSRYIITKGKYRVIPIVLDNYKIPRFLKNLNCIHYQKYVEKIQNYNLTLMESLIQLGRRILNTLKGSRHSFRWIRPRYFVKAEQHNKHILSRLRSLMKRERLKEESGESNLVFNMFKMGTMMKHCILSCKYGDCSFSCSGKQVTKFENHIKECWYIPVKCSNKHCLYTSRRHLMNDHSTKCNFAIEKCPNINCNVKRQRNKMSSHVQKCPYRVVSCANKSSGCMATMSYRDLNTHLKTCPWSSQPCEICGEQIMYKDQSRHICPLGTAECPHCYQEFIMKDFLSHLNSCLIKCELCKEDFPKSKKRLHECPIMQCKYQFCDYKDRILKVEMHMITCPYEPKKCIYCDKYILSKYLKSHTLECNNTVRCEGCGLDIEKSFKTVHDMFLCIGNTNRRICTICAKLVKACSIKSVTELDLHHEMHEENPCFQPTRVRHSPETKLGSFDSGKTSEVNYIELAHGILHTFDVERDKVSIRKHLQPPKCKSGLWRFRKLCEMIDRKEDVKHVVRNGQHNHSQVQRTVPCVCPHDRSHVHH